MCLWFWVKIVDGGIYNRWAGSYMYHAPVAFWGLEGTTFCRMDEGFLGCVSIEMYRRFFFLGTRYPASLHFGHLVRCSNFGNV